MTLRQTGKWYFMRHASTRANAQRVYNPADDTLTHEGQSEACATEGYFDSVHLDKVYSSPLVRALATAAHMGLKPTLEPALADRSFGAFTGKRYGSMRIESRNSGVDPGRFAPPGGESYEDVRARVLRFLAALPAGDYLFITHAGVIMQVVHELTGRDWRDIRVQNCALWVFEDGKLMHENWRPWLRKE